MTDAANVIAGCTCKTAVAPCFCPIHGEPLYRRALALPEQTPGDDEVLCVEVQNILNYASESSFHTFDVPRDLLVLIVSRIRELRATVEQQARRIGELEADVRIVLAAIERQENGTWHWSWNGCKTGP